MNRAVFFDRDGTLNRIVWRESLRSMGAPLHADDMQLEEGAVEALRSLKSRGYKIAVVSNQPDAAKGHTTLGGLRTVHERFEELLAAEDVQLDGWRYCYHHPEGVVPDLSIACTCRKPMPKNILTLAYALSVGHTDRW